MAPRPPHRVRRCSDGRDAPPQPRRSVLGRWGCQGGPGCARPAPTEHRSADGENGTCHRGCRRNAGGR
eukprot:11173803-Lingulodinium_polyedra.AAC.1